MGGDQVGYTILLRGFRISRNVFDAFLASNGTDILLWQDDCFPANADIGDHPVTKLLHKKLSEVDEDPDLDNFRLVVPKRHHYDPSKLLYITYTWVLVYAQRELDIDEDLPQDIPPGFEHLRQSILSYADQVQELDRLPDEGRMGLFAVHQETYFYKPSELQVIRDRWFTPTPCDRCGQVFPTVERTTGYPYPYNYDALMAHRREVHGVKEHRPLPDGV